MIGSVLDKYEVLQKLGEGATATVYRGRHLTIGKDVAIKVLHPHLSASSRYRERFNREARAVGRLSHQNIVSILDYSGQTADDCYIVTELVDGATLQAFLHDRGRIPSEIAALVGADLAAALAFAHTEGVIHRDIKPENVMIRRDGRVKLMDFGVARVLDESSITLDGSLLGSPAYMSPQQALDEPLDGRTDLFSLGTLLFHAVTGHVPFSGTNASVILRNIIEGNRPEVLELAPAASPAVAAVIDRLLQARPDDRYPSALDVRDALLAALAEMGIAPDHPTINLRAYVVDPEGCEAALDALLRPALLATGKDRLAKGDTLGALQLFNRLLAIDEDDAEVIALVQSLHQAPETTGRGRWMVVAAAAASFVALGAAGWWGWVHSRGAAHDPPKVAAEAPAAGTNAHVLPTPPKDVSSPPPPIAGPDIPPTPAERPPPAPQTSDEGHRIAASIRPVQPDVVPVASLAARPTAGGEALAPAQVVIKLTEAISTLDVLVDGVRVGARKGTYGTDWVGTPDHPLLLPPGKHKIELQNPQIDPCVNELTLAPGEKKELTPVLQKQKVKFLVNASIPDGCNMTIGAVEYGVLGRDASRTVELREPDPDAEVIFDCPPPVGPVHTTLGDTTAGGTYFLPRVDK